MKRNTLLLITLLFIGFINNTFADYPIAGYRYLADPGALVYNGRVYVYCSNDDDNGTNYDMHSIVCISSSDLKNWTDHGVVFQVPRDASWTNLSWAPSPAYRNGKFYLYYGNGGSAIGVVVSDSPLGPFKDPVGRAIVNGNTPGVQPFDGWLFDPMTFIDDDGQAYMYFGGNGDNNLRVIKLNTDMITVSGSAGKFTVQNFFEAAWMHKHNGKYYFSYSSNPSAGMRIDYMVSDNPMTGFTYGGVVSPQPPSNNNNNHQAIFKFNNEWYEMYHNRIVATNAGITTTYKRNLALDKFSHDANGKIIQMVNTVDGVKQVGNLDPFSRVEAETMSDQSGIETEVCGAGGMNLAYIDNGDWTMVEGVSFGASGSSSFTASVASTKTGGTIEIRLDSRTGTVVGTVNVPNTGGNQTWQKVTITTTKITGTHNVYFTFKGSSSSLFNVDYWMFNSNGPIVNITAPLSTADLYVGDNVTITATAQAQSGTVSKVEFFVDGVSVGVDNTSPYSVTYTINTGGSHTISAIATDSQNYEGSGSVTIQAKTPQGPYGGTPHPIPGKIEFENYDVGGNGSAYLDNAAGNTGGASFRTDEDVDLENCTDVGTGFNIGYATAGEWVEYTVNVAAAGKYNLVLRAACNGADRTLSVTAKGVSIANNVAIPNTAGWQTWTDVAINDITLEAGIQVIRVTIGATDYINLNYMTFSTATPVTPLPTVTSPVNYCQGATATALSATGTALKWYTTATGGTGSATAPVPSTATVGSTDYFVSQTLNSVESERAKISVVIAATPSAPTVSSPVNYNQNAAAVALTATGTNLKWYTSATGGTGSTTAPTPLTTTAGTTSYYVSQTSGTCESLRAVISVVVTPLVIPTVKLKTGWNMIGCPITGSTDIERALSSIWSNVEVVKNINGFYLNTQPAYLNSLTKLNWGEGYLIKVKTNCELDWIVR